MSNQNDLSSISIAAAEALIRDGRDDFSFYLQTEQAAAPVLYREAERGLARPDFNRLKNSGVRDLLVRTEQLRECEGHLEQHLTRLLACAEAEPGDRARIVQQVGTSVARDLTSGPVDSRSVSRASFIIDNVIGTVLQDPLVAAHMLDMAEHERTTASHMFVVSALGVMLGAEFFGSDYEMLRALGLAGMMHDLGKLAISPEILNKVTPLTRQEMMLIHQHPIESVRILGDDPHVTPAVRQIILQHHEWLDGRGYPLGLAGDEIFPGSRMLTIVDSFHAMTGRRPYRRPLSIEEASRAMIPHAGRQFDADFLAVWNEIVTTCAGGGKTPAVVNASVPSSEELSTRNEHRAKPRQRTVFDSRCKRYTCHSRISVKCIYAGRLNDATCAPDEFSTSLHDVSRSGLCLHSEFPMYRGEVLHVLLNKPMQSVWIRGTVAWCRRHDAGGYRVGMRFVHRITEHEARLAVDVESMTVTAAEPERSKLPVWRRKQRHPDNAVSDGSALSRQAAFEALHRVQSTRRPTVEDERTVVSLARHADVEVRRKCVAALSKLGTRPARAALLTMLKDADDKVREQTVVAAGILGMHEAIRALRQLLLDAEQSIALRAAGALGRLGDRTGLPLAVQMLEHDTTHARLAAQAFGDIIGKKFSSNTAGVNAARRTLQAERNTLLTVA